MQRGAGGNRVGTLASELKGLAEDLAAAPRVYVDANMPAGLVTAMRQDLRWDVLFVLEHDELRRAPDRVHFTRAFEFARTLITLDNDFTDDAAFPPALSPGVIVLSAPDEPVLLRMLRYVDRTILRARAAPPQPLIGRKISLTPDQALHA
jgi:hypothetical protein